jgi:SAM-dependent methyltransferase
MTESDIGPGYKPKLDGVLDIVCCPRCRSALINRSNTEGSILLCTNPQCIYAADGFPFVCGQPALIDFAESIISRKSLELLAGASALKRDDNRTSLRARIMGFFHGKDIETATRCKQFLTRLSRTSHRPRVLIIGGGAKGRGADALYSNDSVDIVGTDIYCSAYTTLLADGHYLPFKDESFDGVWIQAVLEHVLDPTLVVSQIHRVLRPRGLVFSDTPFMQQVHEGPYDFTRFTLSGHRWLFRHFTLIAFGINGGPGKSFIWSVSYLFRALTGSNKVANAISILFSWARLLDQFGKPRMLADGACGVFFLGSKAESPIRPREMIEFYELQNDNHVQTDT